MIGCYRLTCVMKDINNNIGIVGNIAIRFKIINYITIILKNYKYSKICKKLSIIEAYHGLLCQNTYLEFLSINFFHKMLSIIVIQTIYHSHVK